MNKFCSAIILTIVFTFVYTATAQQLKPKEIVYSRLPMNTLAPPTGANSPTIWAVGQDGSNDRMITPGMQPRLSDDDRFMLFRRLTCTTPNFPYCYNPYADQPSGQLWVRDLKNNTETMILDYSNQSRRLIGYYFSPFSNQGNYQIILDYGDLIYKMSIDGTGATPLEYYFGTSFPRTNDTNPAVRRGDSLIAVRSGVNHGITVRTIGAEPPQDVPNTSDGDENPMWSNDNQYLGFVRTAAGRRGGIENPYYPYFFGSLNKIKPDGTGRQQLLQVNAAYENSEGIALGGVWTADNSKIIVAARINGVAGLYAVSASGSETYAQIPISDGNAPDFVGGIVQPRDEQQSISSGGGLLTDGGQFSLLTSIGEPILGDFSGGGFNLSGGFLTGMSNVAARQYEADVQSRPNGDGYIDSDDIQQIRRFAVGLDSPFQNNEFQRADDAPRSTLGDGYIDADDVEQARRYSVGLDYTDASRGGQSNLPAVGGAENPIEPPTIKPWEEIKNLLETSTFSPASPLADRAVRVVNQVVSGGQSVTVPINVDTTGDETGYTFSVAFDRTRMTATSVTIGDLGGNVISNINNTNGTIGLSVASFTGTNGTIPAATNQTLVKINFTTVANLVGGTTTVAFTSSPARQKVSGTDPNNPLSQPIYTNGMTAIAAATGAGAGYIGWWAGDGDARDISGRGDDAIIAPAPHAPGFAFGKVGQAYNFTAEGQYISIPDSPAMRPQSLTIEGWAKLTTPQSSSYSVIFSKAVGTGYNDSYVIYYNGGYLSAEICDSSAGCARFSAPFTTDVWHHIAFTFNDAGAGQTKTGTLYIDGVQVAAGTTNIAAGYDSHSALIGADYDNEVIRYSWTGSLDEISLFNRALTTAEINSIYIAGLRGKTKQSAVLAGANSQTQIGDATITFPNVTTAGIAVEYAIDPATVGTLPENYTNTGLAYEISTNAAYSGTILECFHLTSVTDETTFGKLKILHLENGVLVDRTVSHDFPAQMLCSQTASLSPFVIANGLAPTAAAVSIGGRVLADERGLSGARVSLTNARGETRWTMTNAFGFYHFEEVAAGETYIVSVSDKRYVFASQIINATEDLDGVNFNSVP